MTSSLDKVIKFFTIATVASIIFFSCHKTIEAGGGGGGGTPPPNPTVGPDLTTQANSSVSGFVTDDNDTPIETATVKVGNAATTTDKYGYFEVKNVNVIMNAATVTVTKAGFFTIAKTYIATAGKSAFFRIQLILKTTIGTIDGNTGGSITLSNGLAITLPAGATVNATSNAAYTGQVTVKAFWIDPTATRNLNRVMPGDLRGLNSVGELQLLASYGMAAVELTGSGGELLQIAAGKQASLDFPIPAALQSNAPASIPLWYFDETKGLWKQEGSASRSGSKYTGSVNHFSFWNCDIGSPYVQFNCRIVNSSGQPLPNVEVVISTIVSVNPFTAENGFTDADGFVSGPVPGGAQLLMEVYGSHSCGTPSYSQNFSTSNQNIALGNIVISTASSLASITGTVTDCSSNPITNGYIVVQSGTVLSKYPVANNGVYNFNMLLCGSGTNNVTIIAEDISGAQQSTAAVFPIVAGNNTINLQACIPVEQYLYYTINGISYSYKTPTDFFSTAGGPVSNLYWLYVNNNQELDFIRTNIAQGSVQDLFRFFCPQIPYDPSFNFNSVAPIKVNITEFGPIGYYISGNFSGVIIAPPNNSLYTTSCSFRFKRPY